MHMVGVKSARPQFARPRMGEAELLLLARQQGVRRVRFHRTHIVADGGFDLLAQLLDDLRRPPEQQALRLRAAAQGLIQGFRR